MTVGLRRPPSKPSDLTRAPTADQGPEAMQAFVEEQAIRLDVLLLERSINGQRGGRPIAVLNQPPEMIFHERHIDGGAAGHPDAGARQC